MSAKSAKRALTILSSLGLLAASASAQEAGELIEPAGIAPVAAAEFREPPVSEDAVDRGGGGRLVRIPFYPTIDADEYARLKAAAERERFSARSERSLRSSSSLLEALTPPVPQLDFEGLNQTQAFGPPGGFVPPDTHGAVGRTQFVEVVNTALGVYDKSSGALLLNVSLNALVGYPTPPVGQYLFDPRVVYDLLWDRWIITAPAFAENANVEYFFIAVSQTGDATGGYWVTRINTRALPFGGPGALFDYPQVGLDNDSVIITANIFGGPPPSGTTMFSAAKSRLYNGLAFSATVYRGLAFSLAPPIVLDPARYTYLVSAPAGGNFLRLYALRDSSRIPTDLVVLPNVPVPAYTVPRRARQPGTTATLDTLDARFQNASTQVGESLFNVHTISVAGFPTPRWYEINAERSTVAQSGLLFAGNNSDDFNPAITVNYNKDLFVTWSSTNPGGPEPYFPQVRASGKLRNDPPEVIAPGSVIFTSPTFYTGGRWGDYTAISLDPLNSLCAWGLNEKVDLTNRWGSRIFQICFPTLDE